MTYVIKNITDKPIDLDGVSLEPGEQLSVVQLSQRMLDKRTLGRLQIKSGDETFEERKANADAVNQFSRRTSSDGVG